MITFEAILCPRFSFLSSFVLNSSNSCARFLANSITCSGNCANCATWIL
jgi:hypothetical protein